MKRPFVLVMALMALSITGFGQLAGNPENWCRGGFFTRESDEFRIGVVKGAKNQKAFFFGDDKDTCPGPACRQKAY